MFGQGRSCLTTLGRKASLFLSFIDQIYTGKNMRNCQGPVSVCLLVYIIKCMTIRKWKTHFLIISLLRTQQATVSLRPLLYLKLYGLSPKSNDNSWSWVCKLGYPVPDPQTDLTNLAGVLTDSRNSHGQRFLTRSQLWVISVGEVNEKRQGERCRGASIFCTHSPRRWCWTMASMQPPTNIWVIAFKARKRGTWHLLGSLPL